MSDEETIGWLVERISESVRGGKTPDQAYKEFCRMFSPDLVKHALIRFELKTGRIRTLKEPVTLERQGLQDWYPGPDMEDDRYWPPLYKALLERGWNEETVRSLDDASTRVVSLLQPPGLGEIDTRGLVVGYVQSGKTANFSAVIAKSADIGYKFFIVFSGLTNPLRRQTQLRLEGELVDFNGSNWFTLTDHDRDFFPTGGTKNVNTFLADRHSQKVLCVVKKNATVLKRLLKWLKAARKEVLSNCPVLIIDDEADQASVNASGSEDKRTAINKLILDILKTLPKAAYVGYTATPFANVLINPAPMDDDLYPRDFIIDLPEPVGYFGTQQIFGRDLLPLDDANQTYDGLNVIRIIDDDELSLLSPARRDEEDTFEPEITPSLERALRYFWLATSARASRGDADKHSTMLIHTSVKISIHNLFEEPVQSYLDTVLFELKKNNAQFIQEIRELWNNEQALVPPKDIGEKGTTFDELFPYLIDVVNKTKIVVENSKSEKRLLYEEDAKIQIVIGGNTLSRGLTLEGLVVSFFVRAANAYDTLLQMGRWFGYRPRYADLPRIWITEELESFFYDLATVEQEIRNDIMRYKSERMTPLEFAVRIRTHPVLMITSHLKMQGAVDCDVSYSEKYPQTILFRHKDRIWLINNINATRFLLSQIRARDVQPEVQEKKTTLFRDVPVKVILDYLKFYKFHEDSTVLQEKLLSDYIQAQNKDGELLKWSVAVVGRKPDSQTEYLNLGLEASVPLLNRSKLRIGSRTEDSANLKAIISPSDRFLDLNVTSEEVEQKKNDVELLRPPGTNGLLLIYPIAKNSITGSNVATNGKESMRVPLDAVEHLIGISFVFPKAKNPTPQRYKTADLSRLVREEPEWPEEEEEN